MRSAKSQPVWANAHFVMTFCIWCAVPAIALLLASSLFAAAELPTRPAAAVKPNAESPDPVQAALLAEASGNRKSHCDLLREALKKDPDSSLAHWYAGEVHQDGRWLSLEAAERKAAADKRLMEYRTWKLPSRHASL